MKTSFTRIGSHQLEWVRNNGGTIECPQLRDSFDLSRINDSAFYSLIINGKCQTASIRIIDKKIVVRLGHRIFLVEIGSNSSSSANNSEVQQERQQSISEIRAPMPGLVSKIEVTKGQTVSRGDGLVILEAMKMENEIRSENSGRILQIHINEKNPVEKGDLLLTIAL